jgi:antitoxin (DNA-binding transcriptional repressor) of toxin-antitoxin stability system
MYVTATEFKTNFGKYLELVSREDIFITKNNKTIARLCEPKKGAAQRLRGIGKLPAEYDDPNYDPFYKKLIDEARMDRLEKTSSENTD